MKRFMSVKFFCSLGTFILGILSTVLFRNNQVLGEVVSVDISLQPNKNVGAGFNELTQSTTTLRVVLEAPSGWTIVKNSTSSWGEAPTGTVIWNLKQYDNTTHHWEGTNLTINRGHAGRFAGNLTTGGPSGGETTFLASIADLDMDADTLYVHKDPHWSPTGSDLEDEVEDDPLHGYVLPVLYPHDTFPQNAQGTNYKIIRV